MVGMLTVRNCAAGSLGEELGIKAGDRILEFDGVRVRDILDYVYYDGQDSFVLTAEVAIGGSGDVPRYETVDFEVEKDYDETLGLSFEEELTVRNCRNKCVFCFVDQCAPNMRSTLYVKDDDWRLSFVSGNYVTLTNLQIGELDRIISQGFSPLYISVHATDPVLRKKILGASCDCDIMPILKRLTDGGILVHAQIVLVEGLNDGEHLKKSIDDLVPFVETLAVVPVGLTRFSAAGISPLSVECARDTIELIDTAQGECLKEYATRKVFAADELYLRAGLAMPEYDEYEDFWQIENGVGMCAKLRYEVGLSLAEIDPVPPQTGLPVRVSIATGSAAKTLITELGGLVAEKLGIKVEVHEIENNFFGHTVSVAGLVTGGDIIKQLKGKNLGNRLFICKNMLREFSNVFLDDVSLDTLSAELGVEVEAVENTGSAFVEALVRASREKL